jgi:uncharacterized tellurite resistance protein B-like protein
MPFPAGVDLANPAQVDRLRVAYAVHVAQLIIDADGILDMEEATALGGFFPDFLLHACGFLDDNGRLNDEYNRAVAEAITDLPGQLGLALKLELITLFHAACMADGELHGNEIAVLMQAAEALGVSRKQMHRHLGGLTVGGTIVPPVRPQDDDLTEIG